LFLFDDLFIFYPILKLCNEIHLIIPDPSMRFAKPMVNRFQQTLPRLIFPLLIAGFCGSATGQTTRILSGRVVSVIDGDDIEVLIENHAVRIRLAEVDCPEKGQPFFRNARRFTSSKCYNREVKVEVVEKDRYGRNVGKVTLPDGKSLNHELVRAGYAWWYKAYSKDLSLGLLEMRARLAKRGLWAAPGPEAPWEYRKRQRDNH
jgi:micrococcal nuclease